MEVIINIYSLGLLLLGVINKLSERTCEWGRRRRSLSSSSVTADPSTDICIRGHMEGDRHTHRRPNKRLYGDRPAD